MKDIGHCQSCGMTLDDQPCRGSNVDGSVSDDYCIYCFQNGEFTDNFTVEEMIECNLEYLTDWIESAGDDMTVEIARMHLENFLPKLKRWQ